MGGQYPALMPAGGTIPFLAVRSEVHGGGVFPVHAHDHFEVLLLLSGKRVQHYEAVDIPAEEGHLIFIPPELRHGATLIGPNNALLMSFNLAYLHPELASEAAGAWSYSATLAAAPELLPFAAQPHVRFACAPQLTSRLREMWSVLMTRGSSPKLGSAAYTRAQLSLLLLEVVSAFEAEIIEATAEHRPEAHSERIDKVRAIVGKRLGEKLSIEEVAGLLNISPSCLAARIRRVTGLSFGELLCEARLLRARELLIYTDKRVSEIAFDCGFEDHAYFSRKFRLEVGMSPLNYRRQRDQRINLSGVTPAPDACAVAGH
jgi:AraC-like DNA-binding protein